jgi:cytidine deaminase
LIDSPHSLAGIDPADIELYDEARSASVNGYARISGLQVGAALRTAEGRTFHGFNIEDPSLWQVLHAEQSVVFAAISQLGRDVRIRDIAVYAEATSVPPCGACRQLLSEFNSDIRVIFPFEGRVIVKTVRDLLPFPFKLG